MRQSELVPADAALIKSLAARDAGCFAHASDRWDEEMFLSQAPGDGHIFLVLLEAGEALGYACLSLVLDEAELRRIAVLPEARGRGLAERLLREALSQSAKRGAALVHLEVRETNSPAIALYEKLGFLRVGKRKNYYQKENEDAILMTLELK